MMKKNATKKETVMNFNMILITKYKSVCRLCESGTFHLRRRNLKSEFNNGKREKAEGKKSGRNTIMN
jgi:hypothetical protein